MSTAMPTMFTWKGVRVPYIAPWTGEIREQPRLERRPLNRGGGIAYVDEHRLYDRHAGILWLRMGAVRGAGTPILAGVNSQRQRQAMDRQLCQVCGATTYGRTDGTHLYLLAEREGGPITEGEQTASPPIHEDCAVEALRDCPHLREGAVAARVERPEPWGIAGMLHDPATLAPRPSTRRGGLTFLPYTSLKLLWAVAHLDVVSLHGCTPVNLDELLALTI
ncbi:MULTISPECIES: hypothetical protein [unclassified Streptomyces]|uniref:hypothetical protein n=1 Tax=unclassified Streptomyces TaxID=2593676 RepID=UPI00087C807B|nr:MULTISPECIES: hypothetical protein [unclassified Streptomyces]REH18366.1 hypothetical protein BX268_0050 [Streptomyces sp. 2221.1]SDS20998.1 hypothetical protein SAMN05428941_0054 [Streptomyces sp. 2114.2]